MASGHVKPHLKAEHMAAPTKPADVKKAPCQLGAVHTWHRADMPQWSLEVRF